MTVVCVLRVEREKGSSSSFSGVLLKGEGTSHIPPSEIKWKNSWRSSISEVSRYFMALAIAVAPDEAAWPGNGRSKREEILKKMGQRVRP